MYDFKKVEEEARKIWKKNKKEIDKAVQDNQKKPLFSFLEGPPTANAPPALHHLEVRTFKDIICKFKFMQGFSVPRKGGWDCHGLPVEVQVEKQLKLDSKKDVIKYGVSKFIQKARESVFSNISDWEKSTRELAYWIDLEHPYVTLENDYIESVWWSLKELYDKKFLYEGHKVVPFCPRCGTPLSSHEVAQGYKDIQEESVYVAFKLKNKTNEYFLAWTTTPWTLPGNVALAVGKDIGYVKVQLPDGDKLILGKEKLNLIKGDYKIIENFKGKDLIGLGYEPLYDIKETQNKNSHKIIPADFVTTEDGTGIVHTAVMYGEEDYNVGIKLGLPAVHTVGEDGKFLEIVPKFKGMFVKKAEDAIKKDLAERHLLFKKEKITHSYPFCWRCDSQLLYYAINSWFIKVSSIREKMLKLNKQISWYPEHIKDGRFGKWLEGAKDWALSRSKFWGTPLPIWKCKCGEEKIIGSIEDMKKNSTKKITGKIDLHKPFIDEVKLKCSKCKKEMERIPDVIDCWYDSGSAPFAQFHYPFENKKEFARRFPYDFISEAIDQTRGWFYTMHVISTILFNKPAYKNVICAGHIVDEKGEKMSKSKGNVIQPKDIIDLTGVDAIRLQFCTTEAGNFKPFSYNLMKESIIPFLTILYNCNSYYNQLENKKSKLQIEDKWILSRLNSIIEKVTKELGNYSLDKSFQEIQNFVVNDFSRTYIKMTRDRDNTKEILGEILEKISLLLSPFAPYISENIYSQFSKNSVHLSSWPKVEKNKIDENLEKEFMIILDIIESGLAERDKLQIGLKWPLSKAEIYSNKKFDKDLIEIIKNQLNLKKIEFSQRKIYSSKKQIEKLGMPYKVQLDTTITPELEAEGYARELSRQIQAFRKKLGLQKNDKVEIIVLTDDKMKEIFEKQKNSIKQRTNSEKIYFSSGNVTTVKERFKK
ncbi:MAG: isoleucine--tRNA ligase, partial [Nanoarchaeota archaeon]|nr:isoleucine--tRNA ligase [Nanoarchaeota archaeon]